MGFDSLQEKLTKSLRNIQGKGRLSEKNMEDTLQEIRTALLEADVNYGVTKDFLNRVKEESLGQDVINSVDPGQLLVKIVNDELVRLLGDEDNSLHFKDSGLSIFMVVGLQGTGKTTHVAKIAKLLKEKQGRKVLIVAGDNVRLAAVEQLETLAKDICVDLLKDHLNKSPLEIVPNGAKYVNDHGYDSWKDRMGCH